MDTSYLSLRERVTFTYTEKRSKFIAYAFRANTEEHVKTGLNSIKNEHPASRHLCYAWRLGTKNDQYRYNDDGEPSGTAGRPILGQIDAAGLTNIVVAVVRYYGGVKLGASGLLKAYKTAASGALAAGNIVRYYPEECIFLSCDYSGLSRLIDYLNKQKLTIRSARYEDRCRFEIVIRQQDLPHFQEEVQKITEVSIEKLKL